MGLELYPAFLDVHPLAFDEKPCLPHFFVTLQIIQPLDGEWKELLAVRFERRIRHAVFDQIIYVFHFCD